MTRCDSTAYRADRRSQRTARVRSYLRVILMRAWAVSLGIAIQLVAVRHASALDGHRRITQYAQTHFAAHDGMPHSFASAIAQTADGYLWTTSQEGLSRFDGASF